MSPLICSHTYRKKITPQKKKGQKKCPNFPQIKTLILHYEGKHGRTEKGKKHHVTLSEMTERQKNRDDLLAGS